MLEIAITILFLWIFFKAVGLAFRAAWSITKIVAWVLFAVALPMLVACLIFAGGLILLVPLGLIGIAFGLLKRCI